ncbi:hypothetical protein [Streptomyces liangshanensis]|uniref:Uncharacterized protein n=1 Tax=Streptomyces liangshanensis TaxID=2717324 RepID=A0A6G9H4C0_9ACTN|nr:hypothetical protein [Streptomyces liangshanensis]QIQ05081.1 hypothetical protein HA039_24900 [Streptomyces liangshanensis]
MREFRQELRSFDRDMREMRDEPWDMSRVPSANIVKDATEDARKESSD